MLNCAGKRLDLSRPRVMGVLNVTPDSFSDGGRYRTLEQALEQALRMAAEGAAIIDVGGESSRPGAAVVAEDEELRRVIPVIEALAGRLTVPISIDTCKPRVMREAVRAGAGIINDINALQAEGAMNAALEAGVPVCLMHMAGKPDTMQKTPAYADVVQEVRDFLAARLDRCTRAGIPRQRLLVDPGFGFGKTPAHNLLLLRELASLQTLGVPVLVGLSRKSLIGEILDSPVDERLQASLVLAALAADRGASIIRAHDVRATVDALAVCRAVADGRLARRDNS